MSLPSSPMQSRGRLRQHAGRRPLAVARPRRVHQHDSERRRHGERRRRQDSPTPGSNDEAGDKVVIGFSAPAADHGWMGSITEAAKAWPISTTTSSWRVAEGTNDVNLQISQVETFINDGVDAIVLLPFDGAAMTPVALKAMKAGIPVINVDREFDDPNAARVTVLGDNYGMGVSAGSRLRSKPTTRPTRSSPRSPASTRCR